MIGPEQLLTDAEELALGVMSPARRRTVVSRAYYASYHFLLQAPFAESFVRDWTSPGGMHRQFIQHLTRSASRQVRRAGQMLERLYARRILADYHLGRDLTNGAVREALEDACEIVREMFAEEEWANKGQASE